MTVLIKDSFNFSPTPLFSPSPKRTLIKNLPIDFRAITENKKYLKETQLKIYRCEGVGLII